MQELLSALKNALMFIQMLAATTMKIQVLISATTKREKPAVKLSKTIASRCMAVILTFVSNCLPQNSGCQLEPQWELLFGFGMML